MLLLFLKLMFVLLAHGPGALGTPVTDFCVFGNWADPLPLPLFNNLADSSSHPSDPMLIYAAIQVLPVRLD